MSFSYELESIDQVALRVIQAAGEEKIWIFKGEMGAGKTTLIKALSKEMDVVDSVSSPTFGIINEYQTAKGDFIFHWDGTEQRAQIVSKKDNSLIRYKWITDDKKDETYFQFEIQQDEITARTYFSLYN